jgi:dephospho-CoA kinase
MLVVGLTGGIASGKSTVLRMLKEMGARVIDLDALAREVVEPGRPAWEDIVRHFGKGVVRADGTLDRAALGRIVFNDAKERRILEGFVHPRVWEENERLMKEIRGEDPHAIVVVDVPLLMELGLQERWEAVIVVYIPREMQLERLMRRDGCSREEAEARLGAQMPIEEKVPLAHFVIDNSGDPERTEEQVRGLMERLRQRERGAR